MALQKLTEIHQVVPVYYVFVNFLLPITLSDVSQALVNRFWILMVENEATRQGVRFS